MESVYPREGCKAYFDEDELSLSAAAVLGRGGGRNLQLRAGCTRRRRSSSTGFPASDGYGERGPRPLRPPPLISFDFRYVWMSSCVQSSCLLLYYIIIMKFIKSLLALILHENPTIQISLGQVCKKTKKTNKSLEKEIDVNIPQYDYRYNGMCFIQ